MRYLFFIFPFIFSSVISQTKLDPAKIDIVRDAWGVPHIFAKTDAEVAYGLAWAHAEDDFKTIQQGFLAGRAMLGIYSGKGGATIDFIVHLLKCRQLVDSLYDRDISTQYKSVLQGYCDGINSYANSHPKLVLIKKLFPVAPKDMLTYSALQLAISSGADMALQKIFNGTIPTITNWSPGGSNGYAFNSKKTTDGNVYLAINSHQPLEGPVSWYEAHLCSDEGWNILGALFPGSPNILHGCNPYLGWAHTVNNPDKLDVYQLKINPANKIQYNVDGKWLNLKETKIKLKVKIAGVPISVSKKIYESIYGPTIVTKQGVFSIRTGALMDIRALEQWYRMNKAKNFYEFKNILSTGAIPGYNIVYADRYDTIYYLSNGKIPIRDKSFQWNSTVPGNTLRTRWTTFHPLQDLPQVTNPPSGFVFNSNHSPFLATTLEDNIKPENYDPTMGYETNENNRSRRFMELLPPNQKINYDDFKRIKYDLQLPSHLAYRTNPDTLFLLKSDDNRDVASLITELKQWNRKATIDSKGAAIFGIIYYQVQKERSLGANYKSLSKEKCLELLRFTKTYLLKNFHTTDVSLGQYQKLVRGNKSIPLPGLPDVISSMTSVPYKDGKVKGNQGESYIELVKFTKEGPEIESINCYGASNNLGDEHFSDQMELFTQQKTKSMTLDKEKIYRDAKRIYHPR